MDIYKYDQTGAIPYTKSQFVARMNNCNGFIAINTGKDVVRVNDQRLFPGQIVAGVLVSSGDSITIGGNVGEIYLGNIKIQFESNTAPEVTINQKYYLMDKTIV